MLLGESVSRLAGPVALMLGWSPATFWGATPAELAAALRQADGDCEPPDPEAIEALLRRFPDARG